jgi:hypothetical protein
LNDTLYVFRARFLARSAFSTRNQTFWLNKRSADAHCNLRLVTCVTRADDNTRHNAVNAKALKADFATATASLSALFGFAAV